MPTTTPDMNLVLPDPSITIGPLWAQMLNDALELIDAHDHTTGKGVVITPPAMNINSDLSFHSNAALLVKYMQLISVASAAGAGNVYRIGNDLWYNNGSGVPIQLTTGSVVNAPGSGVISASVITTYPYSVITGDAQKALIIDTSAARVINLQPATTAMFLMIKDGSGLAQTNPIQVTPDGTDTVDGVNAAYLIDWNYGSIGLVSDGVTKWHVV